MPICTTFATTALGAGVWDFKYNRMNYMFDQSMRFNRFTAGCEMACRQAGMYREDVRDLTNLTVEKQARYHVIGTIMFVCSIQLVIAGRLGVHGPAMPGWHMSLYWATVTFSFLWLVVSTWLSMHAAARAHSGATHMLTRSVRLPVPSNAQLDKARSYGSSFEKQRVGDMFRVPFVTPAPHHASNLGERHDEKRGAKRRKGSKTQDRETTTFHRSTPVWVADERDLYTVEQEAIAAAGASPVHFALYRNLMHEWWSHDIYARISLLLAFVHWLMACAMYVQCHFFGELRTMWAAWSTTMIFVCVTYGILLMDILPTSDTRMSWLPMEYVVPVTPLLTCLGLNLEYSIIDSTPFWTNFIFSLSWVCYATNFLWAVRLYDIAKPRQQHEEHEVPGHPWWPSEWCLPSAFYNVLYLVAPPAPHHGETCLQLDASSPRNTPRGPVHARAPRDMTSALYPWKMVRGGILVMIATYLFLMGSRICEQIQGPRFPLRQSGRVERYPAHMQPWMPPWTREGARNEWSHTGGADRRLDVMDVVARLEPVLTSIINTLESPARPARHQLLATSWPLQPEVLACGAHGILALSRQGMGVQLPISGNVTVSPPFVLRGIVSDILGASWSRAGLLVVTSSAVYECVGQASGGHWPCSLVVDIPTGGSSVLVGTVVRSDGALRIAVEFLGDASVTVMDHDDNQGWIPAGEIQRPQDMRASPLSLTASGDLLVVRSDAVVQWPLSKSPVWSTHVQLTSTTLPAERVVSLCQVRQGLLAHLVIEGAMRPRPQVFLSFDPREEESAEQEGGSPH